MAALIDNVYDYLLVFSYYLIDISISITVSYAEDVEEMGGVLKRIVEFDPRDWKSWAKEVINVGSDAIKAQAKNFEETVKNLKAELQKADDLVQISQLEPQEVWHIFANGDRSWTAEGADG